MMIFLRREHDVDVAADQLGLGVGMSHAGKLGNRALHHIETDLGVRHLAAAELEAHLHLVAVVEEFLGVTQLRLEVVLLDARGELDLLDLAGRGLRVRGLLLLLVDVLAEVHDPAHRRRRVGRHLNEVEAVFQREVDRLGGVDDPELFALGGDQPHLRHLDPVVAADGREGVDVATLKGSGAAAWGGRRREGHQWLR